MKIEDWPILNSRGFLALYSFEEDGVFPVNVSGSADVALLGQRAEQSIDLLRAASFLPGASTIIARTDSRTSVATLKGGLVCEGNQSLNVGLFLPKVRDLEVVTAPTDIEHPAFDDVAEQAIWHICARIARCEVPRVFLLRIGNAEVSIQAKRGWFDLLSGAETATEIGQMIRDAVAAGNEIAYSIGDSDEDEPRGDYAISNLLVVNDSDEPSEWNIAPDGKIAACPQEGSIDVIAGMLNLRNAALKLGNGEPNTSLEVRANDNTIVAKLRVDDAGHVNIV